METYLTFCFKNPNKYVISIFCIIYVYLIVDKKRSSLDKDYEYISHTTLMRNYRSVSKGKGQHNTKLSASFTSLASIGTVDENNYEIYPYAMFG